MSPGGTSYSRWLSQPCCRAGRSEQPAPGAGAGSSQRVCAENTEEDHCCNRQGSQAQTYNLRVWEFAQKRQHASTHTCLHRWSSCPYCFCLGEFLDLCKMPWTSLHAELCYALLSLFSLRGRHSVTHSASVFEPSFFFKILASLLGSWLLSACFSGTGFQI